MPMPLALRDQAGREIDLHPVDLTEDDGGDLRDLARAPAVDGTPKLGGLVDSGPRSPPSPRSGRRELR